MSWEFFSKDKKMWYDDLCKYYKVDAQAALELGSRSDGRKPSLPGSKTCKPVVGMTFEDIWESKPRGTVEEIFQFQKDQGAWSTFRQCVRHKDLAGLHGDILFPFLKEGVHICEYGCGIAPFSKTLLNTMQPGSPAIKLSLTDVKGCEHFYFAEWRLKKQIEENNLNVELNICPVTAQEALPKYNSKLDVVTIFEVLEHIFNPLNVIHNLFEQMNDEAIFVENFIDHDHTHDGPGASDLDSAAEEREEYYKFLFDNFVLISGPTETTQPDATRIWRKK